MFGLKWTYVLVWYIDSAAGEKFSDFDVRNAIFVKKTNGFKHIILKNL